MESAGVHPALSPRLGQPCGQLGPSRPLPEAEPTSPGSGAAGGRAWGFAGEAVAAMVALLWDPAGRTACQVAL